MRRRYSAPLAALVCLLALAGPVPETLSAQGVRGSARSSARYLDMRPITRDSVSLSRVEVDEQGRRTFEGFPVVCIENACFFYRSLPVESAVALTQDVSFTAWGLGVEGLSATALLRGRARLGGDYVLPLTEDPFDAILAYAELNRELFRVRLGRQQTLSTLGTPGFDGVELMVTPRRGLRAQAFGGRSLGRALYEPRSSALRGLEDAQFLLDDEAYVVGAELAVDARNATGAVLRYQREIFSSRGGLLSERVAGSFRTLALRPVTLRGSLEYDVALDQVGKAQLTAALPLLARRASVELTARRYAPLFELWTIWGFFSPVAFNEAELRTAFTPAPGLSLWATGAYRAYEDTETFILGEPLRDEAWRATAGGFLRLAPALTLNGSYQIEGPVGAFSSAGDAALAWAPVEGWELSLRGMAAQQLEEFRIGEGVLLGGGVGVGAQLTEGLALSGGFDLMRHTHQNRPSATDWNQRRGWMMLQIDFGRDPGRTRSVAR
jgi:hypothetical protein